MVKQQHNLLELIPKPAVDSETSEKQTVNLLLPRYGEGRIGKFLERHLKSTPIKVKLDEFGSEVWQLCNGRRRVSEIGHVLEKKFGEKVEPVNDRLALFFKQLERGKCIQWIGFEK